MLVPIVEGCSEAVFKQIAEEVSKACSSKDKSSLNACIQEVYQDLKEDSGTLYRHIAMSCSVVIADEWMNEPSPPGKGKRQSIYRIVAQAILDAHNRYMQRGQEVATKQDNETEEIPVEEEPLSNTTTNQTGDTTQEKLDPRRTNNSSLTNKSDSIKPDNQPFPSDQMPSDNQTGPQNENNTISEADMMELDKKASQGDFEAQLKSGQIYYNDFFYGLKTNSTDQFNQMGFHSQATKYLESAYNQSGNQTQREVLAHQLWCLHSAKKLSDAKKAEKWRKRLTQPPSLENCYRP